MDPISSTTFSTNGIRTGENDFTLLGYLVIRIINIDKLAVGAARENITERVRQSGRYQFVEGNLLDIPIVSQLLIKNKIDTVIHFAAITHVDESYENRIGTIQENVIATTSLLEAVNVAKTVRRFVHISTDEVYGDSQNDGEPKTETSLFNPTNPYAASKAACELIVKSYHHSYKLPYVMVRMNNVFGPRQAYTKLIPKFTKLAIEGKPYPLMGDGMHTRSWMFVDDCAEAIVRVTERGQIAECYNIGIEFEKANLHLTQMIHEIVSKLLHRPSTKPTFAPIPDRPYHDRRYFIDFSKIRDQLNWECSTPFVDGLTRTIEYYVEDHRRNTRAVERLQG
ncbi:DTDP-D-glucose 4,6-dehydratase [Aphelenchoides besseyi]|nr:DTDP-D-glucose 4,6-dehydratase [Aphelenchoides besseyi]